MIICFDLRALQIGHENRGIGMYIKSVLEHLPADANQYFFYVFDKNNPIDTLGIKLHINYKLIQTPTINTVLNSPADIFGLIKLANHSFSTLRAINPDVFVQFDFALGIPKWRKLETFVIGYDLIPLIKKNEYLPSVFFSWQHTMGKKAKVRAVARSLYYRMKYRLHYQVFRRADHIISISAATSQSFAQLLGIQPSKIHAIPLAPVLSAKEADHSITKAIKKPYILYIGGTDTRKRIQDIVYAFHIARGRGADIQLVLAGNEFNKLEHLPNIEGRNAIIKSPYKDDILLLGFVSDAKKLALYNSAHAFIFCTTYEGFGLPIIEAMSASCPVISYNNSSIPEAAGDAAILVETGDYVAVANQILSLQNAGKRKELIQKGLKQAQAFNWDTYVGEFKKLIQKRR